MFVQQTTYAFKDLTQIPGIGEKVALRISECAGDEKQAIEHLNNGNFLPFLELNSALLQQLVRIRVCRLYDCTEADVFQTVEIKAVYTQILQMLRGYCITEAGKTLLYQFFPTSSKKEILRRQAFVSDARTLFSIMQASSRDELRQLLKKLEAPQQPQKMKSFHCVIAVEDEQRYAQIKREVTIPVRLISSEQDVESLSEYDTIRYVKSEDDKYRRLVEDYPQTITLEENSSIEEIAPEIPLSFFLERKENLTVLCRIFNLLSDEGIGVDDEIKHAAAQLESFLSLLGPEGLENTADADLQLLKEASKTLATKLSDILTTLNKEAEEVMSKTTISGAELLQMLSQMRQQNTEIPPKFKKAIEEIAQKHLQQLEEQLHLKKNSLIDVIAWEKYPLATNDEELRRKEKELRCNYEVQKFEMQQEIVKTIAPLRKITTKMMLAAAELDVRIALGDFTSKHNMVAPSIIETGFAFSAARHIFLSEQIGSEKVIPIDYHLGTGQSISVVTGANSGGKTTLLDTIAQLQLLSQCGLFVPAQECSFSLPDQIYYFGKNRGDKTAGAFETLLRSFSQITESPNLKKLVLADEIEAVTEPGAAAIIISSLLNYFEKNPQVLICLVTHLGTDIAKNASKYVRIDGIEAKGLDENLNLIVDRNPKLNTLATSTPELILERLAKKNAHPLFSHIFAEMKSR